MKLDERSRARFRTLTRVEPDGSLTSIQTLDVPGARMPTGDALESLLRELARVYTSWISRLTAGCVEILAEPGGVSRARVVPVGPTGLVLGAPLVEGGSLRRAILEGVLVGEAAGTLGVRLRPSARGVAASVELHGFRSRILSLPVLGRSLFLETQDVLHVRHSRGFLRHEVAPRLMRRSLEG